jgi:hypothetical protein
MARPKQLSKAICVNSCHSWPKVIALAAKAQPDKAWPIAVPCMMTASHRYWLWLLLAWIVATDFVYLALYWPDSVSLLQSLARWLMAW